MSDDPLAGFDRFGLDGERVRSADAAAAIERLTRERDEARAEAAEAREPVAWRVPVRWTMPGGGKHRMFGYTEMLPYYPSDGYEQLGEPEPLYTHPAHTRTETERELDKLRSPEPWEASWRQRAEAAEAELAKAREALATLLQWIELQGRQYTTAPRNESRDDAASRDERDQVFGREMIRARAALAKPETEGE